MKRIESISIDEASFKRAYLQEKLSKRTKVSSQSVKEASGQAEDTSGAFKGPWAKFAGEDAMAISGPSPSQILEHTAETAEAEKVLKIHRVEHGKEKTALHYKYSIGPSIGSAHERSKAPQGKIIHSLVGHAKAVNSVTFFPTSGHLLLSASMDCNMKIWSTGSEADVPSCVRTIYGHNRAMKGAFFAQSGKTLCGISFDKYVKLWDTESGQCTLRLKHKKLPYSALLMDENAILVGIEDGSIIQWDLRSGQPALTYEEHNGTVNSLQKISPQSFVSLSDDCSIRLWDLGTLVSKRSQVFKELKAFTKAQIHSEQKHIAVQCLSEKIASFEIEEEPGIGRRLSDNYRILEGHSTKGFACSLAFSCDGRLLASGDGKGHAVFWDWKSGQLAKKIKAHDQACVAIDWHPCKSHTFATGGWDGLVKIWQ